MLQRPASGGVKTVFQVLCCLSCHEVVNGHWYYPKTLPPHGDENPFAGRCRNCGSNRFTVGEISTILANRLEREGWWLIPYMHDIRMDDPTLKRNIFVMSGTKT